MGGLPFQQVANKVIELLDDEDVYCENNSLLEMRFTPYSMLNYYIDGFGAKGRRDVIDIEAKPKVEQLRKELQAMIDEIDALKYE